MTDSQSVKPLEWIRELRPGARLSHQRWAVLVRLALAMNRDGSGWVTRERLAKEAVVSESTVDRAIEVAIDHGCLLRTSRGHGRGRGKKALASTYQLCRPAKVNSSTVDDLTRSQLVNRTESTRQPEGVNSSPNDDPVAPTTFAPITGVPRFADAIARPDSADASLALDLLHGHYEDGDAAAFCEVLNITSPLIVAAVRAMIDDGRPFPATVNYARSHQWE